MGDWPIGRKDEGDVFSFGHPQDRLLILGLGVGARRWPAKMQQRVPALVPSMGVLLATKVPALGLSKGTQMHQPPPIHQIP